MARIETIEDFLRRLTAGQLSWQQVSRFVEIDPEAPVMRLRMRPGVLPGRVPDGIDVDELVYQIEQKQEAEKRARRARVLAKLPAVIADGDSWFHLPPIIRPTAIADRIGKDALFGMNNLAHWGDTLSKRVQEKQYLNALANQRADWLILSGGGNDMQVSLAKLEFLFRYDAARPLEQAITPAGGQVLEGVTAGYTTIFSEVQSAYPSVKILCYAYDYPKPTAQHSEYIGKHLNALGYPPNLWPALVQVIIHHLAAAILAAVAKHPGVAYLDCFGVAQSYPWFDDMHPDTDGFKALAKWFEARMARATHTMVLSRKRIASSTRRPRRRGAKLKRPARRST
jgi:GDSL-like Lipase/Acylhydrolase family